MTRDLECRLKDILWGEKLLRRFVIDARWTLCENKPQQKHNIKNNPNVHKLYMFYFLYAKNIINVFVTHTRSSVGRYKSTAPRTLKNVTPTPARATSCSFVTLNLCKLKCGMI